MSRRIASWQETFEDRFVQRAIETESPVLAIKLYRYAVAEGMTWESLARSLDCTVSTLNRVAICRPPRPESFIADVEAIADNRVNVDKLLALLRRLQALDTFRTAEPQMTSSTSDQMLMAAMDREDSPTSSAARTTIPDQLSEEKDQEM